MAIILIFKSDENQSSVTLGLSISALSFVAILNEENSLLCVPYCQNGWQGGGGALNVFAGTVALKDQ